MFTQAHYKEIARVLANELVHTTKYAPETTGAQAVLNIVYVLTGMFNQDNMKFDKERFQSACGLAVKEQV